MTPTSVQKLAVFLRQPPLLLGLLGLALIVPLASFADAPNNLASAPVVQAESEVAPGEILVKFEGDVSSLAIQTANQDLGTAVIKTIPQLNVYRLRIPEETTIAEMIELYQHTPGVVYAEPNYIAHAVETIPDDSRYADQWALPRIEAPAAWDIITGTNDIVMAIIDTGIDYTHPDLAGGRYNEGGYDFVNDDDDPMDDEGHGTHVTGIATADTDNGEGIAGLAWNSQFMAVKVLDATGTGTYSDIAAGVLWAANHGARVANLSLGGSFDSQTLKDAMHDAYAAGVVMACATGNDYRPSVIYPAAYDECLAVAATDSNDERAAFSNYGPQVNVAAPGVGILSTTAGGYESWNGTSMATPHVAGLAALILAQDPDLPVDQVFAAIRGSADDVNYETDPGRDDYLGTGRINAYRALTAFVRIDPPDITVDLDSSDSSFTVDLVIEDIVDLGSFQFDMSYDPAVVSATHVALGPFLGSTGRSITETSPTYGTGNVTYGADSWGGNPGPNGDGLLATIIFDAVGIDLDGSPLQLNENMTVTHTSGRAIPVVVQDGSVMVAEAIVRIEPPDATACVGFPFTVTAPISNVTNLGSFQFDMTYVSRTMKATSAVCGPFLGSTGRSVSQVGPTIDNIAGKIALECSSEGSESGPDGDGVLATITFDAVDLGGSPLKWGHVPVTNTAGVAIAVGAQDGNVTVECCEDVNRNGVIDIVDIQRVAFCWNRTVGEIEKCDSSRDINGDGRINIIDVQKVAVKFHQTC